MTRTILGKHGRVLATYLWRLVAGASVPVRAGDLVEGTFAFKAARARSAGRRRILRALLVSATVGRRSGARLCIGRGLARLRCLLRPILRAAAASTGGDQEPFLNKL